MFGMAIVLASASTLLIFVFLVVAAIHGIQGPYVYFDHPSLWLWSGLGLVFISLALAWVGKGRTRWFVAASATFIMCFWITAAIMMSIPD